MARATMKKIRNYAVYYGPDALRALSEFDLVIVEPSSFTPSQLKSLQSVETKVIAYVTVMEVGEFHIDFWSSLNANDFLEQDGRKIERESYDTFVLDLRSANWRQVLYRYVGELLTQTGYDGIFLDTIGDVEIPALPSQMEQIDAAVQIVADLRRWFPGRLIIQNNGLEKLCLRTAEYVDAIVWENPPLGMKQSAAWVNLIAERLIELSKMNGPRIMTLFDRAEQMTRSEWLMRRKFSDDHHFLTYFAPTHYIGPVRIGEPKLAGNSNDTSV